jgi:hypothetical protein
MYTLLLAVTLRRCSHWHAPTEFLPSSRNTSIRFALSNPLNKDARTSNPITTRRYPEDVYFGGNVRAYLATLAIAEQLYEAPPSARSRDPTSSSPETSEFSTSSVMRSR